MAIFDIPGLYLHTETDEEVIMFLEGSLDELMLKVSPKIYGKCVIIISKGKPLLYVQIQKSVYGLLLIALLFCRELVKYLNTYVFQINPYNPCVENKMINENHIMVV